MAWNGEQRAHAVETLLVTGSTRAALRALRRQWGSSHLPTRRTLERWVREFRQGQLPGQAPPRAHHPRLDPAVLRRIRRAIRRNPRRSTRDLARSFGVSQPTVSRYLRQQLRLFPYKLQLSQRLKRGDKAKRQRFCRWLMGQWGSPRFRQSLLFSDEANFYLNGLVNKQNCRVWGRENPHALVERDIQSPHLTVWCGLSSRGVIGPYFFQSGRGARSVVQTVTGARYREMLEGFVLPELERQHYPISRLWFQQDGATPHTTRGVLAFLAGAFPGKVISKKGDVPWPPRSPDLSPLDFFLWGHLKDRVYGQPVRSLRSLRERITQAIQQLPIRSLRAALEQLPLRARWCLRRRGRQMEGMLPH